MQEIELKFQIPEAALAGVEAELQALAGGPLRPLPLRAAYFDTADRKLAGARMALRVRQEGDDWVQTLKAGGSNTMMRLEDNRPTQPAAPGQPIEADLGLHDAGPARQALTQVLGWQPDTDPQGRQTGLIPLYQTDIVRWRVQVKVARGTPEEGTVELALDLGHIHAGPLKLPVRELEIEAIAGNPMAVIATGRDWVARHGLWLDTQTKAHRGDRLARQADRLRAANPEQAAAWQAEWTARPCPFDAGAVTLGRPAKLPADATLDQAWRAGLEACLEHMTGNLSELATLAPAQPGPAAYEWRRSLRRLRALGRLWADSPTPFPHAAVATATRLSSQLGWWRDQEALAWLPPKLAKRGLSTLPLPHPPCPPGLPETVIELARSRAATDLCLDLLASLLHPVDVDAANAQPLRPWLTERLNRLARKLARRAPKLKRLGASDRHSLRRKLRQLHDLIELHSTCVDAERQARHGKRLARALRKLGALQDETVALDWYQQASKSTPGDDRAQAVCDWLTGRQPKLARRARKALQAWAATPLPW